MVIDTIMFLIIYTPPRQDYNFIIT